MLVAGMGASALGQETTGSISGTVTDATGAAIKGATVAVVNTDRNETVRTLTTNNDGFYTATSLPVGNYSLKVTDAGFKDESVTSIILHVNDALTFNPAMHPGAPGETVSVTADEIQVNLEDSTTAGLIEGTQVRQLVLNNRNYEQLVALQPGVSYGGATDQLYIGAQAPNGTTTVVSYSVNGQRNSANNWTIDGADNVDRGSNLTLLAYPSVDAIAEFKTLRGTYSAAFGRSASSQINVVTRSGTNQIHGSAYEFFRNDYLNANSWGDKNTSGAFVPRPKLRYNDFGGTFGAPIWRDHTFGFFSYEGRRVINYAAVTNLVPTAQERLGNFTASTSSTSVSNNAAVAVCTSANLTTGACNAYGTQITTFSPTALAYLKDIYANVPLPNPGGTQDIHTLTYNQKYLYNDDQYFFRIDQKLGDKMLIFYRYLHDTLPTQEAGGIFVGGGMPGVQTTATHAPATTHLGHLTYTISPTFLVDVGYAYSSGAIVSDPIGTAASAASKDINPTLPFASTLGVVPSLSFGGSAATAISNAGIYRDYNRNHNPFGDVTKILGNHTLLAGFTYSRYQKTENALGNGSPFPQGSFSFVATKPTASQAAAAGGAVPSNFAASFANFLIGNANGGFTQGSQALTPNLHANQWEAYVQDNWKVTRRLTLNLGVRYSYFAQPTDSNNLLTNFAPAKYNAANAPTVDSNGFICKTAPCANTEGLNSGTPNGNADALNGIVLGTPGNNGHPSPYGQQVGRTEKYDFAPRVGFAFDVFGDGHTALRGGYGIAYDSSLFGIYEQNEFANPPYVNVPSYTQANLDNPTAGQPAISLTVPSLVSTPYDYHTPYTQQFSLDVQQQLAPSTTLDIGYVGNLSRHLLGQVDINQLRPGSFVGKVAPNAISSACVIGTTAAFITSTCERPLNQIRPYVGYTAINAVASAFTSNYHSLQVQMRKRFRGESLIDVNYTWSRALTYNQSDRSTAPQNTYDIKSEYGRSALDRTNILTIDGVWELPWYKDQRGLVGHVVGGWELSGIVAVNSGLPLTVTMSGGSGLPDGSVANDAAGLGILGPSASSLRPDMIFNPNNGNGKQIHTKQQWFNTAAFTAPAPGTLRPGNERRGVIEGPGFNRVDAGAFRNFRIVENVVLQARLEGFNIFNHTNFQTVGTSATSGTFGQVTAARDNRIVQIAAKLVF